MGLLDPLKKLKKTVSGNKALKGLVVGAAVSAGGAVGGPVGGVAAGAAANALLKDKKKKSKSKKAKASVAATSSGGSTDVAMRDMPGKGEPNATREGFIAKILSMLGLR